MITCVEFFADIHVNLSLRRISSFLAYVRGENEILPSSG